MVQLYWQEIKIPKQFFTDDDYKGMSNNAKLLYGLLANKLEYEIELASEYKHYPDMREYMDRDATRDENGYIYVTYPTEELATLLNVSKSTVTKLFKELEAANLIERRRRGLGKPDNIYVGLAKDKDSPYYEGD